MKKIFKYALLCMSVLLVSCGGGSSKEEGPKEFKIKPETTKVSGPLTDCYEVVDKEYTLNKDGYVTIEIKRTDAIAPFDPNDIDFFDKAEETGTSMLGGFGIEFLDENNEVVAKVSPQSAYSWDDISTALRLIPGETASIKMHIYDKDIKPVKFRITSDLARNDKAGAMPAAMEKPAEMTDDVASEAGDISDDIEKQVDEITNSDEYKKAKEVYQVSKDVIEAQKEILDAASKLGY